MSNRKKKHNGSTQDLDPSAGRESNRRIAKDVGMDRADGGRVRSWAEAEGLLRESCRKWRSCRHARVRCMPTMARPDRPVRRCLLPSAGDSFAPEGVESAAMERLKERGFDGSYSAVWRYIQKLDPSQPDVTVRVETAPGAEVQVDFGYAEAIQPKAGNRARGGSS